MTVKSEAPRQIDHQLLPFINASNEVESQAALEQLICNHAQPLIKNIVGFKLQASSPATSFNRDGQEVEDVSSEVIVRLIGALREDVRAIDAEESRELRGLQVLRHDQAAFGVIEIQPSGRSGSEVSEYARQWRTPRMSTPIRTYCPAR